MKVIRNEMKVHALDEKLFIHSRRKGKGEKNQKQEMEGKKQKFFSFFLVFFFLVMKMSAFDDKFILMKERKFCGKFGYRNVSEILKVFCRGKKFSFL